MLNQKNSDFVAFKYVEIELLHLLRCHSADLFASLFKDLLFEKTDKIAAI